MTRSEAAKSKIKESVDFVSSSRIIYSHRILNPDKMTILLSHYKSL